MENLTGFFRLLLKWQPVAPADTTAIVAGGDSEERLAA